MGEEWIGQRLLGTHEAARILSVDAGTVIRWTKLGQLPCFRTPGGHRRIRMLDLLAFAERYGWLVDAAPKAGPAAGRPS